MRRVNSIAACLYPPASLPGDSMGSDVCAGISIRLRVFVFFIYLVYRIWQRAAFLSHSNGKKSGELKNVRFRDAVFDATENTTNPFFDTELRGLADQKCQM